MREILGKFGTVTVIAQLLDTPTVFVTFNHIFALTDGDRFWGDDFFAAMKTSAIGVMTDIANWYPEADMAAAVVAIRAATMGRRVVTYGTSQGGYGALKFAAAVGATVAVAFNPQYTIKPEIVGNADPHYPKLYVPGVSGGDPIRADELCASNYIIYDRFYSNDAWHADRLAAFDGVTFVTSPFTPHGTINLIAVAGLGPKFLGLFCRATLPQAWELRSILRAGRPFTRLYHLYRLHYLLRKQPQFREELRRIAPASDAAPRRIAIGVYLAELGLTDEAAELLAKADTRWLDERGLADLLSICRRTGQGDAEILVARAIFARPCWEMLYRIAALESLTRHGLLDEANPELDTMVNRWGPHAHPFHVRNLAVSMGRDDIVAWLDQAAA